MHTQTEAIQICQQENRVKVLQWARFYPEVNPGAADTFSYGDFSLSVLTFEQNIC